MIKKIINALRSDKDKTAFYFSVFSLLVSLAFAVYNGVLGVVYLSIWNGCICVYYIFLLLIRCLLVVGEQRAKKRGKEVREWYLKLSFVGLFLITFAMLAPVALLILNKRTYGFGLIPAIAMAAYAVFSIIRSVVNLKRARKSDDPLFRQGRLIDLIAALMSLLVLQNTMILANGAFSEAMQTLSFLSSLFVIAIILFLIVYSMVTAIRKK